MNRALGFAIIALSIPAFPQAQKATGKATYQLTENERLAIPVQWDAASERMFKDSQVNLVFNLTTSWIPGPGHKGMFRYRMGIARQKPPAPIEQSVSDLYTPEAIEKLLTRTHECTISVDFYDTDDFILRRIDVPFSFGIDSSARVVGLVANDFVQMDADEYKKLVVGRWAVSWLCDPLSQ